MEWHPAGWSLCLPLLIFPCTMKSRNSLLAPAHLGGPRKRAIKRCVLVHKIYLISHTFLYQLLLLAIFSFTDSEFTTLWQYKNECNIIIIKNVTFHYSAAIITGTYTIFNAQMPIWEISEICCKNVSPLKTARHKWFTSNLQSLNMVIIVASSECRTSNKGTMQTIQVRRHHAKRRRIWNSERIL